MTTVQTSITLKLLIGGRLPVVPWLGKRTSFLIALWKPSRMKILIFSPKEINMYIQILGISFLTVFFKNSSFSENPLLMLYNISCSEDMLNGSKL